MPSDNEITELPQHWAELVSEAPGDWFDQLKTSPKRVPVAGWPFAEADRRELEADATLRDQVGDVLHERARIQWLSIPAVEDVADWISGDSDPDLEKILRRVALARESAQRQVWLRVSAGLLSAEAAETKLAAIGALPAIRAVWRAGRLAIEHALRAVSGSERLAPAYGARLAVAFASPAASGARHQEMDARPASHADWEKRLAADGHLTVVGDRLRLSFRIVDDALRIKAGEFALRMLGEFAVEFRRQGVTFFRIDAVGGEVTLTPENLRRMDEADEVAITTP